MTQPDAHAGYDDEDDIPEWVDQVTATIAAEIRRRRKELRMSAQDLADACTDLGHPIPRNVIANMESGRRATLPLVDVMVLAKALNTAPIALIYPVGYVEDVQQLPLQHPTSTWNALAWFTGEDRELDADDDMLRHFREHHTAQQELRAAQEGENYARYQANRSSDTHTKAEALRAQAHYTLLIERATDRLRTIRAFIRQDGATPPLLWPDVGAEPGAPNSVEEESDS
ncbi:helix-turn-helix domain-containing protein [Streptomyces alkaliphilus]|uniref:helix-turn-helix domain-containing protein n=1 Tax=Streptomyces alkaliphilus TaxID=1472722 RepID=UPI00117E025F|nr:helix-turn-helix transcriptional regulator [Streptomyces alkaliphilus]MQS05706.1 transcriptional regulator [Streptomyces alkaliphilus]